ncbi:MAG TPA: hypothetical protein VHX20_03160 [Terracidiphilus sp.]|nr:hypothetical protein [Terracidiphilus sp.]
MSEKRNRIEETLEWLHHAYWIREFLVSSGVAVAVMKWIVSHVAALSQYGWAIWLIIAGLLMYLFTILRAIWPAKKRIAPNPQSAAALVINPTETPLPSNIDIKEFFRLAYRTASEAEVRKNFYLLAHQEQPNDPEKFYLEFIGIGFIAFSYDNIWWPMYASQLPALLEVNRNGGFLTLAKVREFFDQAAREFQEEYKSEKITFDAWFPYLTRNQLVIHHPSDMVEITVKGKDYLKYLTHLGRGLAAKRL